ncbi:MAG: class I SAM-dependent methyltransferase [Candidatus Hydrogenedentes bacterium]|nr:class I SAM-dependent methyltransferase [Candidatus Hydrogenedentota bacterium]
MTDNEPNTCGICQGTMRHIFRARILRRHDVDYHQCGTCDFIRTETPYWLNEAYSEAISRTDTGLVARNISISRALTIVLFTFFDTQGRYLDVAGGTGLLTRLMRDIGFDFYWDDPYCANVHAQGFAATGTGGPPFEAVTAIEALEHSIEPVEFVRAAIGKSATGTLLFTTELFRNRTPAPDWWYYSFPTGQHISFFSRRTLEALAHTLGLNFVSDGALHMYTRQPIRERPYLKALAKADKIYAKALGRLVSRTQADNRLMLDDH